MYALEIRVIVLSKASTPCVQYFELYGWAPERRPNDPGLVGSRVHR
jgi:hypothetical protein